MAVFTSSGSPGAGAGFAAYLLMKHLLAHLEASGKLSAVEVNSIASAALAEVPPENNAIKNDARALLEDLR